VSTARNLAAAVFVDGCKIPAFDAHEGASDPHLFPEL
jgi:hypothetical protein